MATYVQTTTDAKGSTSAAPTPVSVGATIGSTTYQQMLQILDDLTDHTHTTEDYYTSVCQCQCACGRGIL